MKKIADIRLFASDTPTVDGRNHWPNALQNKASAIFARRVVMKLREQGFSLGGFDHLYINFTTCAVEGNIAPAKLSFQTWYRFYDVHVDKEMQKNVSSEEDAAIAAQLIQSVLLKYFAATEKDEAIIVKSINAAKEGDKMTVLYMEKKYSKCTISVYISLNNKGEFCPILQIMKKDGTLVQRKRMKPCIEMGAYGDIRFDGERVLIKPRKNAYYAKRNPIVIELPS
ncbi:MAG: hypothetical protein MR861_07095 [Clostridiales bacterium]|nr:hypothetical protein [Clostridiales bacterium]